MWYETLPSAVHTNTHLDSTVDDYIKMVKRMGQNIDSKMSQAAGCSLLPPSH